jgi:hypothetical protein
MLLKPSNVTTELRWVWIAIYTRAFAFLIHVRTFSRSKKNLAFESLSKSVDTIG